MSSILQADPIVFGPIRNKIKKQKKESRRNRGQRAAEKRRNDELQNLQGRSLLGNSNSILSGRPESATTLLG